MIYDSNTPQTLSYQSTTDQASAPQQAATPQNPGLAALQQRFAGRNTMRAQPPQRRVPGQPNNTAMRRANPNARFATGTPIPQAPNQMQAGQGRLPTAPYADAPVAQRQTGIDAMRNRMTQPAMRYPSR